jgi:hypothetical protein
MESHMETTAPHGDHESASSSFPNPHGWSWAAHAPDPSQTLPRPSSGRRALAARLLALNLIVALGPLTGCATLSLDGADTAQLADVVTTGVGLSTGLVEANPVVAPLASAGPPGLVALAGVKVGLNRLARQQEPDLCRYWLGMSSAAGWAAATSNLAMLVAPPLAVMAIPMAVGMYYTARDGAALETCYRGMISEAVLRVPEDTRLERMPPAQRRALTKLVGVWPDPPMLPGSRPSDGHILVQTRLIADPALLEQFARAHGLDWCLIAVQGPGAKEMVTRDLPLLARHISIVLSPDPDAASLGIGDVAIQRHRSDVWQVARASAPLPSSLQRSLAQMP